MRQKSWEDDKAAICDEIAAADAPFKIVLKTKNETLLLQKWIEHHRAIVGEAGLIVFDNGSTEPDVVVYLDAISDRIAVYRYASMHNTIHHDSRIFRELYLALRGSCRYYLFLDTDEYLFWAEADGSYLDDARIAARIAGAARPAIPGIWAENQRGCDRRLRLTFRNNRIPAGIRGGKPVMSSAVEVGGFMNHNNQLPLALFDGCAIGNVVIGHLKAYSAEQRIAANIEKLSSYNRATNVLGKAGLSGPVTLEALLALDRALLPGNAGRYVDELQRLVAEDAVGRKPPNIPAVGFEDGRMAFENARERDEVLAFLRNPAEMIATGLRTPR